MLNRFMSVSPQPLLWHTRVIKQGKSRVSPIRVWPCCVSLLQGSRCTGHHPHPTGRPQHPTCPTPRWSAHRSHRQRVSTLGRGPIGSRHHSSLPTHPHRWTPTSGRPLCRSSTHRCPESQRTSLPRTPSQFQVPPCRFRNRSGRPLERGSSLFHHQPRPSQKTRHPSTVAPGRHRLPHIQMDRFPHTCGIDSICSHPHFRRPNPPSQPRGRTPHLQWPPCTTPPWPCSLQPPPPPPPLTCQWTLPLDFAHLETGQYKNSPNAWKLPTETQSRQKGARKKKKTPPWEPETTWPWGIRLGKIQQTSDHTYKQTRELEIAIEVLQCCCHASHAFSVCTRWHWRKCN